MSRRRIMMQMLTQADSNLLYLLEDYKQSWNSGYTIDSLWNGNIVTLKHTRRTDFSGPSSAAMNFIGAKQVSSSGSASVYYGLPALPVLDSSKRYRLVLTVVKVTKNTAVDASSGVLWFSLGTTDKITYTNINICDISLGTTIAVENESAGAIKGAVISATIPSTQWDFDFDVRIEEV